MADPRLPRGERKASLEGLLMDFEEWVANQGARGEKMVENDRREERPGSFLLACHNSRQPNRKHR